MSSSPSPSGTIPTHRRAAVLGHPIGHSLSPALHRAAYAHLGLPWTYEAIDCRPDGLADVLRRDDPAWVGWSLTMPLKESVLPLLDAVDPLADTVRAVNTVLPVAGRLIGHNTDVPGLVEVVREVGADGVATASVLGAGATARSALAALAACAVPDVTAYVRRPASGEDLQRLARSLDVSLQVRPWERAVEGLAADLVVATVPAGATDELAAQATAGAAVLRGLPGALVDVVYSPWPTPLAAAWERAGGTVAGGLELLVHQAVGQVRLMTGQLVPVAVLRDAGTAELAHRG
jgi:shikimate dehydrogenase